LAAAGALRAVPRNRQGHRMVRRNPSWCERDALADLPDPVPAGAADIPRVQGSVRWNPAPEMIATRLSCFSV
jgi:hypothetical protein